jgi:hypothetical protein
MWPGRSLEEAEGLDMFGVLVDPEDGDSTFLRNVGKLPD